MNLLNLSPYKRTFMKPYLLMFTALVFASCIHRNTPPQSINSPNKGYTLKVHVNQNKNSNYYQCVAFALYDKSGNKIAKLQTQAADLGKWALGWLAGKDTIVLKSQDIGTYAWYLDKRNKLQMLPATDTIARAADGLFYAKYKEHPLPEKVYEVSGEASMERYNKFDSGKHLKPDFSKTAFDTLHSWDFGWAVLKPINVASSQEDDKWLARRFSPGQKALYFIWYLDEQVTNGGFIQFYVNGYRKDLPPIVDGLKLIGDKEMLDLVEKADRLYLFNKDLFEAQGILNDPEPLYKDLKEFDAYDDLYYRIHDHTMALIEKYARQHPDEFLNLK
jgi:hypothetical protein